jgi:hypothetical protein
MCICAAVVMVQRNGTSPHSLFPIFFCLSRPRRRGHEEDTGEKKEQSLSELHQL